MRKRWSRVAGAVALVATTGAAAAAFQIDADVITEVASPATGLWVPAPTSGEIVHVDVASGQVTARVEISDAGADVDVAERDNGVVVVDRTSGRVSLVDPAVQEVTHAVRAMPADRIDIGPESIVLASNGAVAVVDPEVTAAVTTAVPAGVRSIAADGEGLVVENGDEQQGVDAAGEVTSTRESAGRVVRVVDRVVVVDGKEVRATGGDRVGCLVSPVVTPDHLIGTAEEWVVALDGATLHVADLTNGECVAVVLGEVGPLGRPVVSGRRVFVPEVGRGIVHIVDPSRGTISSLSVFEPGDLRIRARGDFVIAYDLQTSLAVLLDTDGVISYVDTSAEGRGVSAALGEGGPAVVVGAGPDAPAVVVPGGEGISASADAPIIDASILATTLDDAVDEADPIPDDELVANFSFSANTVVVGELVRFVDRSSGSPDAWLWDFGDGTGDEGPNVEKAWDEPGSYPVKLVIRRGEETAEISLAITVVPDEVPLPPAADFVFSSTVVETGDSISFEDRSDGEIERWRWDFGDGTTATAPNVTKAWDTPGRYTVQLTVANEQGSDSASVVVEVIEGLRRPVAVITVARTEVDLGAPLAFRGASSTDPARLSWDFGDGRTATGDEVVHVFLQEGDFRVTLTAENDAGRSTAEVEITVSPPTLPPTAVIAALPAVIEVGDVVTLTSLSTNSPDTEEWSFGDDTAASGHQVTHAWAAEGTYLLTLTAANAAGSDSERIEVEVVAELPPPVAQIGAINASPWVGEAALFRDASIDATAWFWDFGDGVTSNARDPLHTFTSAGPHTVTLTVSNRNGTDSTFVIVEPRLEPIAGFVVSSTAIRAGESITFTDDSVNAVKWFYDFGDGTPLSGSQNPVHTYTTTGSFSARLTVENATGDVDTYGPVVITVDPAAPALSGIVKVPVDAGTITTLTTATFEAVAATASGPIERYQIEFGDGSAVQEGTSPRFSHVFDASGSYTVRMRARGPLGDWSAWVSRAFTVVDPAPPSVAIGTFPSPALIGSIPLNGVTQSGSGPIDVWRWRITRGASTWNYTGQNVTHNFGAAGDYSVTLTAEGPVADATASRVITITTPPPPSIVSLTADPSPATTGVVVSFTPVVNGSVEVWEWDYEGGGYIAGSATGAHIFNTPGAKVVKLRVTGPFGGQAVMSVPVTVHPRPAPTTPVASPASPVTTGTTVTLSSTDSSGLSGLTWGWVISNGATSYTYSGPSINHRFDIAGSWTVTVTATDARQISGSAVSFVEVQAPLTASFAPPSVVALVASFAGQSSGPTPDTWLWDFGDGTTGTGQNPVHIYLAANTYTVVLEVRSGSQSATFSLAVTVP